MAVIDPIDPFASDINVSSTNDQSSELMDRLKPDYDKNFAKYQQRLAPYTYQAPSMSFYDLASELGAGLLATPNTGGASAFTGLGVGFTTFGRGVGTSCDLSSTLFSNLGVGA